MEIMDLKSALDQINVIINPKYAKAIIIIIALIVIERTVHAFITDNIISLLSIQQEQRSIEMFFDLEVPMVKMTIFWPIIFLMINVLHRNIRVSKFFYNFVVYLNAVAATLSAIIIILEARSFEYYSDDIYNTILTLFACYLATLFTQLR